MHPEDTNALAALSQIGITITPNTTSAEGWGWSIANEKLIQPWVGPYPTSAAAVSAALDWLMHRAWKGVLCSHSHGSPEPIADRPHADADLKPELLAPWERAFASGAIAAE
ncbi:MAG TPA: hypothetical protein PLO33_06030 [Kouleothrix sp.]|uniref:hypothetical protein n=1 Tax=Kouleothrix sp. TaxID=2779161 RepID=UPI002BFE6E43|nr:hypothetical protein [Kouleothrix sp.]HRC75217.1 hypothetical protein [Kouleothrix sp.]